MSSDSKDCQNSASLLAYASSCAVDQCDRPIFGTINFCPQKLSNGVDMLVSTAIHELAHVSWRCSLGFSGFSFFSHKSGIFSSDISKLLTYFLQRFSLLLFYEEVLVFSNRHFQHFRNSDGSPMIPRVEGDTSTFQNQVTYTCSSGGYAWDTPNGDRRWVLEL